MTIVALRADRTPKEISDFLKINLRTVQRVSKVFSDKRQSGKELEAKRKRHDHSQVRKRSKSFLEELHTAINDDPSISFQSLATLMNVSKNTMGKAIHEDLRYKSYVLKICQHLTDAMKAKRVAWCELLLSLPKHQAARRMCFFSDEKIFTVEQKVNRRNDRWLTTDLGEVPIVGKRKFPTSIHILLLVSSEGHVMPPHYFSENVNKEVYLDILWSKVKPWIEETAGEKPYIFQQDSAPAHTSHIVQNWLSDNMQMFWSKEFWPPNSPDLNPMDYYMWGMLERESNKVCHPTAESLRAGIDEAVANLDPQHLVNACVRFRHRLEAVLEANGSWIE